MTPLLRRYFTRQQRRVDGALRRHLLSGRAVPPRIHEAMRYSVFAGGKRLRPVLCLAAAELCGGSREATLPAACALEMIHTYSLIHDDLPAMDNDDFRRGKPTSHRKFGEAVAILAGDALLTRAFELMARATRDRRVAPAAALRVIESVAEAAGSLGMIGGQVMDIETSGRREARSAKNGRTGPSLRALNFRLQASTVRTIHEKKTGALIRASLRAGALLAKARPAQRAALDRYGESVGLAFQIADDVLDVIGDKKLLGKRGSDRDNKKLTYPALYGLGESRQRALAEVRRAKEALRAFGPRAQVLRDLADFIVERKK